MVGEQIRKVLWGLWSLLVGMKVTLINFFRPKVTVEYPRERLELSKSYRSAITFVQFEQTGTHDCVACNQCARICPSNCIRVEGAKPEGVKRKRATVFDMDFALCSLCGLCIDVCPTKTLTYSKRFDEASYRREEFVYDLLDGFREGEARYVERMREETARKEAEKAAKKKAAERAAPASATEDKTGSKGAATPPDPAPA